MSSAITVEKSSVSSIFRTLDNRIINVANNLVAPTINANLLYKSGSDLVPIVIPKISY
jgi:hypothetical protein